MGRVLLCSKPSQTTIQYTRIKTHKNHFRVEGLKNNWMQMFDCGIDLVFDMLILGARDLSLNFVGVLKDILKLDYGHLHTPMANFRCEWIKQKTLEGTQPMYEMMLAFSQLIFSTSCQLSYEPFIFPCQTTQMTSRS